MEIVTAVLVGVAIGALAVVFGRRLGDGGHRERDMAPRAMALVRLSRTGTRIDAKPPNVPVHLGGGLRWEVNSAAGDKVEIEFNNPGGPFAHDPNNPHNPRKGRYETMQPTDIDSNPATAKGRWKYTVTWTPAGGAAIILDPEVCIRGG